MPVPTAPDTAFESLAGWPNIVVFDHMHIADLTHHYSHEAMREDHRWATGGWTSHVRYRDTANGLEAVHALTYHHEIVSLKQFTSIEEAIQSVDEVEMHAAYAVSRTLAAYVESMCHDTWTDEITNDFLDARWRYQALTGMHVEAVTALCDQNVTFTSLLFLARANHRIRDTFAHVMTYSDEAFEDQPRMWEMGPLASRTASADDLERLRGPVVRRDLADPVLVGDVLNW